MQSENARRLLICQATSLIHRIEAQPPFALTMPSAPAAGVSSAALASMENYWAGAAMSLKRQIKRFIAQNQRSAEHGAVLQQQFVALRLAFSALFTEADIFADILTQRAEHGVGLLLRGMDVLAGDIVTSYGLGQEAPPIVTYLDRGASAAIRRAFVPLPSGRANPLAMVRIPRERMPSTDFAPSLAHEVGHQLAVLDGLLRRAHRALDDLPAKVDAPAASVVLWKRWLGEVMPDVIALERLGVCATLGLISILSLPREVVMTVRLDAVHPTPWLRVLLSCALGNAMYPDPQWKRLAGVWRALYPMPKSGTGLLRLALAGLPNVARCLAQLQTRPSVAIASQRLRSNRSPSDLRRAFFRAGARPPPLEWPPSYYIAVLGQAKADGLLAARLERHLVETALSGWALKSSHHTNNQHTRTEAIQ